MQSPSKKENNQKLPTTSLLVSLFMHSWQEQLPAFQFLLFDLNTISGLIHLVRLSKFSEKVTFLTP